MMVTPRHTFCLGRSDSSAIPDALVTNPLAKIDAHRRRRGPYTAAGDLIRVLVPAIAERWPELIARHDVEILAVAPELGSVVTCERETLTSSATADERTRFYPRARTRRVAHGLIDLLNEVIDRGEHMHTLIVDRVEHADPTDAEWLSIVLRRAHPQLRIVLNGDTNDVHPALAEAIGRHAVTRRMTCDSPATDAAIAPLEAARLFVDGDCTSEDPVLVGAYEGIGATDRARLHDARAVILEAAAESSLRLGAIPYHRARGTDPAGAGAAALLTAIEHCVLMGFYDAVIELGRQCLQLLEWDRRPEDCWLVVAKVATALTALDRADEAAALYDEACASSTHPSVLLQAAYGRAMLFTRFYDAGRLDHQRAKAHINTAIAISELLPEGERRAFNLTFNENGLALVEMHLGDVEQALRLVTAGLERLDREIGPDQQTLYRSVLRYNRAQLLTRIGPPTAAIAEYTLAIASDPHHSEYYFERAGLHRQFGHTDDAIADYQAAIRLSPPYPEPHYNLADIAIERGNLAVALTHLDRVIDLEPDLLDAYVSRAGIHHERGHTDLARADIRSGLAVNPRHPELHCLEGILALNAGDLAAARIALDAAINEEPALVAAWANRAVVAFENGDSSAAINDLDAALALEDRADLRLNRALVLESLGRYNEALTDYEITLDHSQLDDDAHAGRQRCLAAIEV